MSHDLLGAIDIRTAAGVARIELRHGDLTETSPEDAVDILVVSAYPDDYSPALWRCRATVSAG